MISDRELQLQHVSAQMCRNNDHPCAAWANKVIVLIDEIERLRGVLKEIIEYKPVLFDDGISADLHESGIKTPEAAYVEGLGDGMDELKDIARKALKPKGKDEDEH